MTPQDELMRIYEPYIEILRASVQEGRQIQIVGMPRTGKTRLIEALRKVAVQDNFIPISIDIRHLIDTRPQGRDELNAILTELFHQMEFWADRKSIRIRTRDYGEFSDANEIQRVLTRYVEQLTWESKIVWILDSADAISLLNGAQAIAYFEFMHSIVQQTSQPENFTIVQVSQHYLPDLFHGETLTSCSFFIERLTQHISVRPLNFEQFRELISFNANQAGTNPITNENVLKHIYEVTGGHPYLIRRMSNLLFLEGWDWSQNKTIVDKLYKNTHRFLNELYLNLSSVPSEGITLSEKEVVRRIASGEQIWNLDTVRSSASRTLIQTEVIKPLGEGDSQVGLFSPLFQRFLTAEIDVAKSGQLVLDSPLGEAIHTMKPISSIVYINQFTNKTVSITGKEAQVFQYLKEQAGRTVSHEEIIRAVWGNDGAKQTTLNKVIERLRKKIEPDSSNPQIIVAVYGKGFQFISEQTSSNNVP